MFWNLLSWYFILLLLGWLTFPLAFRLFHKLDDHGYTLSRALGLLLWGFVFWLLCSLGVLQNHPGAILFALVILTGVSVWAGWRRWKEIWDWVRAHWRLILTAEIVFLMGFIFMTAVRACNPAATGTEKPMELAFINAILNSETFPPHDPWLSGYAISYYHFGYILAAMLAKLTATSGSVAFNLMLVVVFAMSGVGAYGVVYNLLSSFGITQKKPRKNNFWALTGPLFLLFVSNLEGVLEVLHQAGVGWNMTTGTSKFWGWINIESLLSAPKEPLAVIPHRFWWWWQASRVIQDIDLLGNVSGLSPIDEFPAFSFVLGDLHPHVLVMPFVMLVVGLALNIFHGGMDTEQRKHRLNLPFRIDLFMVSAVILGGITFLNTWDLPVYFALVIGAFVLRKVTQEGWAWKQFSEMLLLAIPLGILSLLLYLPFILSFQSQAGGILPNVVYPTRGLYMWLMFGTLFIPILLFFGWLCKKKKKAVWNWSAILVVFLIVALFVLSIVIGLFAAKTTYGQQFIESQGEATVWSLLISAIFHRLAYGVTLLTLAALLIVGLAYMLGTAQKTDEPEKTTSPVPFVLLMVVLGGIMVLAPEFVYLKDNFGARMNTIFKFYYQAWMLWSLAVAFATVVLLRKGSWVARVAVILVTLLGLVYPVLAFLDKTDNFMPAEGYSLDAAAYMQTYQQDEVAAIEWVSEAPDGIVAEAVGGQYSGYARVSIYSGKATVLGWPGHEGQWRGGYTEVGNREGDIKTLYETPDWETALAIIRQYDIRYIYIGSLEYRTYTVIPSKFEQHLQAGFEQGGVIVYVVPDSLLE